MSTKEELRDHYKAKRLSLPAERRESAEKKAVEELRTILKTSHFVLSYDSLEGELDLTPLNHHLAEAGRLVFPKIDKNQLSLYIVGEFPGTLTPHPWGMMEPDPNLNKTITPQEISAVLVPALAFDHLGHRLGFGGGFFDRFLPQLNAATMTIGVGFREQLSPTPLPTVKHDISLNRLILV